MSLDWFRATGSACRVPVMRELLCGLFGEDEPGKGLWFYDHSYRWHPGVALCFTDVNADGHCAIELSGQALAQFSSDERVAIVRDILSRGFRATRVDVAIDVRAEGVSLLGDVIASCQAGHLCGAVSWSQFGEVKHGEAAGQTVYLGVRGKDGSGRLVRVYDKGLETGTASATCWVRWEAEFAKDCAAQVAERIALASEWITEAASVALGAVDFREVNGSTALERRPRVAWWSAFLGDLQPERVTARRSDADLASFCEWLRRSVAPTLHAMAQISGRLQSDIWRELVGDVEPQPEPHRNPVIQQWARLNGIAVKGAR